MIGAIGLFVVLTALGCEPGMANQPYRQPLEGSAMFADRRASRELPQGTVPRGHLRVDSHYFAGRSQGEPTSEFPLRQTAIGLKLLDPASEAGDEPAREPGGDGEPSAAREQADRRLAFAILQRGQQRYDIFCAPCHDRTGHGQGMVVQRGFPAPPALHIERLRQAPVGHLYEVITHGRGRMPSYLEQIPTHDRWAIAAYVQALQLAAHADAGVLPEADRRQLEQSEASPPPATGAEAGRPHGDARQPAAARHADGQDRAAAGTGSNFDRPIVGASLYPAAWNPAKSPAGRGDL